MATLTSISGLYSAFHQCDCRLPGYFSIKQANTVLTIVVLRIGLHVLHGRGIRPSLPRRPSNICQRTSQRTLWRNAIHDLELPHRTTLLVYVFLPVNRVKPDPANKIQSSSQSSSRLYRTGFQTSNPQPWPSSPG